ncbi:prephenate dehydratase [Actinobaculum suis]|uniref:Prephenate dehydratase n=1 Tax=Actinobaculum suis TaxID=1657 RepID=A0A0K9ESP6_9ACTO|nr:prephenate dehydratase [Actinobaculum suis]KMY23209.1 prephenate dehydratase [Actinobaculum suis]VDG75415.1 prephenate dehydratase [Actinobaculum suis]
MNASAPAQDSRKLRFSFLGPRGTFCHAALNQVATDETATLLPAADVPGALRMIREGKADYGVVPIENSVEGGVNATIDTLTHGKPLEIIAEMVVPIAFALAVRPGTQLADIRRVGTHGHAWAQTRNWMAEHLPEAVHVPTTSTAAAARDLGAATGHAADFDAAICAVPTVAEYGLESLSNDIADNKNAVTRFILVGQPGEIPAPTGADKTTLMVQLPTNEAGALLRMLEQFSARGVNLSRIESRPIGDSLGRYAFSIDAEAHVHEERMQAVMVGLHRVCPKVTFLGSYPAAHGRQFRLRPGTSDADFLTARAWVGEILDRVSPNKTAE